MRKDRKSAYQAKKEKLLKIKQMLWNLKDQEVEIILSYKYREDKKEPNEIKILQDIWEIVRDEK